MKSKLHNVFAANLLVLFILMTILITCREDELKNPWDEKANLTPEEWAPQNLSIENISITEKKLTWTYDDKNIEGFKIERRANSSTWEAPFSILSKDLRSFYDTTVLPDTTLTYEYRLFAIAGNNKSTEMTKAIKILFPAPTNLSIVANGETMATLTWSDNSNGEDGFQIERSIDNTSWVIIASVPANSTTYQENGFPITEKVYYRNSAFSGQFRSTNTENFISRLPNIVTSVVTNIASTSATCGGNVTLNGGLPITTRGVCWSTNQNPTVSNLYSSDGSDTGVFTSSLTGLTANTLYYVRAYATNRAVTAYGSQVSFTTSTENVTDIDGNVYSTVMIGAQLWMAENLEVTHYHNGESIPNVTDIGQWIGLSTGAYCWYNNDELGYGETYGALYNWFTVVDSRNLCPTGYHMPSNTEWMSLADYLGDISIAGGKMKESGTVHWYSPNTGATNESGFTGVPGGCRSSGGTFGSIGFGANWWSSTSNADNAFYLELGYDKVNLQMGVTSKKVGLSVRCLKD